MVDELFVRCFPGSDLTLMLGILEENGFSCSGEDCEPAGQKFVYVDLESRYYSLQEDPLHHSPFTFKIPFTKDLSWNLLLNPKEEESLDIMFSSNWDFALELEDSVSDPGTFAFLSIFLQSSDDYVRVFTSRFETYTKKTHALMTLLCSLKRRNNRIVVCAGSKESSFLGELIFFGLPWSDSCWDVSVIYNL